MPRFFRVRDFERQQHYKTRTPPWVKLYNALLEDYAFGALPDAAKAHLLSIFLLASRHDNQIPFDGKWVRKRINARTRVDLAALEAAGFITGYDDASAVLALLPAPACTEREEETEAEGETETEQKLPAKDSVLADAQDGYSPAFEKFWRGYPTNAVMSKVMAWRQWQTLKPADQDRAIAALPAYRAHCARDKTYRPVNPDKFLFERRFDQLTTRAAQVALDETAMKTLWDGRAAPLVAELGAPLFHAWFGEAVFAPGPPVSLGLLNPARCFNVNEMFGTRLRAIYGDDIALVVAPKKEVTA